MHPCGSEQGRFCTIRDFHRKGPGPAQHEMSQGSFLQPRYAPIPVARKEEHRAVSADHEPSKKKAFLKLTPKPLAATSRPFRTFVSQVESAAFHQCRSISALLPLCSSTRQHGKMHVVVKVTADLTQLSSSRSLASCKCCLCMSAKCTSSR